MRSMADTVAGAEAPPAAERKAALTYAAWLGVDTVTHPKLIWIARSTR